MKSSLNKLLSLIDEYDNFGAIKGERTLHSIAVGTLRKDRAIAKDILTLLSSGNGGPGALALCRIMIEDYLSLNYLALDSSKQNARLDLFYSHPYIDKYAAYHSLTPSWRSLTDKERKNLLVVVHGFVKHKDKFIRPKRIHKPYSSESYYHTWTKLGIEQLMRESRPPDDTYEMSLSIINTTYGAASAIIHHNANNILSYSSLDENMNESYMHVPELVVFVALNNLLNLVIEIDNRKANKIERNWLFTARQVNIMLSNQQYIKEMEVLID